MDAQFTEMKASRARALYRWMAFAVRFFPVPGFAGDEHRKGRLRDLLELVPDRGHGLARAGNEGKVLTERRFGCGAWRPCRGR